MIVTQRNEQWLELTEQHEHAFLSYEIAKHWHRNLFPYPDRREEVLLAIREHDRAWIPLDKKVTFHAKELYPHDFIHFPLQTKLDAYRRGVDEVEAQSAYAAILCSLHFCSFFKGVPNVEEAILDFLKQENSRQERLMKQLTDKPTEDELQQHFRLLQFCDDCSLYVYMNKRGVSKENEVSWFKDGFRQPFDFAPEGLNGSWQDKDTIRLTPFPFEQPFSTRRVSYLLETTATHTPDESVPLAKLTKEQHVITFVE